MHLVQFLLPLRDNERRAFPRADFEKVRTELTEHFGGVTAFLQSPASGAWLLFEVMVERLDREWWSGYREELERRFRQERIVVRALGAETL
ncbi:MAG TPA: hypothetical protein VFZ09_37005 [Archangium sp.]|uniref:hypothetical protein n=1 Tax=Archangium sp. TaxID=1872627 RepID=UPI002E30B794|nr:hypothetical protein [Archangium sp.]HEX5751879.1 hypothetical protein [Archangium sp.]